MTDTIAAIATPPGRGGIGIVRLSGTRALAIAKHISSAPLKARYAHLRDFYCDREIIDHGLMIYFPNPHSFTGEDVVEFQCHGGPVILDRLLKGLIDQGARLALPGEFSQRAYLNDKIDLVQAEAMADLIDAASVQAARNAQASLKGVFSEKIHQLIDQLTQLRLYVEAAIDFPEEEIDFITDSPVNASLTELSNTLNLIQQSAQQGVALKEGLNVVITGKPNVGKSSLLNQLAGQDRAIVTPIAGTTRDSLKEHIYIDGMPLHITDTAGLRETHDEVEQLGIERARQAIHEADVLLVMIDSTHFTPDWQSSLNLSKDDQNKVCLIVNKVDLASPPKGLTQAIAMSAKTGEGIDQLKQFLLKKAGIDATVEHQFTARRRHLSAIKTCKHYLDSAKEQLGNSAFELLAQDLTDAQTALGEITGKVSADELLGHIFSSFCIGK